MKINKNSEDLVGFKSNIGSPYWTIHKAKFCSFRFGIIYVLEKSLTSQLLKELISEQGLAYLWHT